MAFDVTALLDLWGDPLPESDDEAVDAFARHYHDPVTVNGTTMSLLDLVQRGRAVQEAMPEVGRTVLDVVETDDKVAVAFRMHGRHDGTFASSAGPVPATGQVLDVRVIDILTIEDGRIASLWMVADELGALHRIGAAGLTTG